jgi:DHA2 family methylenomycin A resistance protein-like MFS transporter
VSDGVETPGPMPGAGVGRGPGALVAICVAYFMVILDTTVVNVALPVLGRGLHTTTSGLEWVVDGYSLAFAALLLSAGALADRRGAKAVFQSGVALFTAASVACGLAPSTAALVAARAVQGVGAALAVPASLALLQAACRDQAARRRAFGIWGGVAGIAAGAGPVLGGALVSGLGWRSVFFVNLPIAAAGLTLGARYLPSPVPRDHGIDPAGQAADVVALAALTAAVIEAGSFGWASAVVLGGLGVFAVSAAAFVAIERRAGAPMLPLGLFASARFSAATTVGLLINLGFYGELFVLSLYLQEIGHLSPLLAGVALLPQMAMAVVGSTVSGRVMARRGPRLPMLAGLAAGTAGLAALEATVGPQRLYWPVAAAMVAVGFGMAFTMPAATAAVMESAPPGRGGLASGTLNAARQVGGLIGVGLLGTQVAHRAGFVSGLQAAIAIAAGAFALGDPHRARRRTPHGDPPARLGWAAAIADTRRSGAPDPGIPRCHRHRHDGSRCRRWSCPWPYRLSAAYRNKPAAASA